MDVENARLATDNSKLKEELEVTKAVAKVARSQSSVIEAILYKIFHTKAFGDDVNRSGMAFTPLATTDEVELISLDFPKLDIKKDIYGYDKEARRLAGRHLADDFIN